MPKLQQNYDQNLTGICISAEATNNVLDKNPYIKQLSSSGLPDGCKLNSQFGYILEGLGVENVGIFYGPLGYILQIIGQF
jgi:hypothetical protein